MGFQEFVASIQSILEKRPYDRAAVLNAISDVGVWRHSVGPSSATQIKVLRRHAGLFIADKLTAAKLMARLETLASKHPKPCKVRSSKPKLRRRRIFPRLPQAILDYLAS